MLYVIFVEIFWKSQGAFMEAGVDEANAYAYATLFFLGRFLAMTVLDRLPVNT